MRILLPMTAPLAGYPHEMQAKSTDYDANAQASRAAAVYPHSCLPCHNRAGGRVGTHPQKLRGDADSRERYHVDHRLNHEQYIAVSQAITRN